MMRQRRHFEGVRDDRDREGFRRHAEHQRARARGMQASGVLGAGAREGQAFARRRPAPALESRRGRVGQRRAVREVSLACLRVSKSPLVIK